MALNCKPGDLARVIPPGFLMHCPGCGAPALLVKPDTLVVCVEYVDDDAGWSIAEPIPVGVDFACGSAAVVGRVSAINDRLLRPIRDPGDDAVDEILERVGMPEQLAGVPAEELSHG